MRPDQGINNYAQVPLSDILLDVPEGIRLTIDWPNDGGVVGRSSYIPVGRYCHEASAYIRRLEKKNAQLRESLDDLLTAAECGSELRDGDSRLYEAKKALSTTELNQQYRKVKNEIA